MKKIAILGSTGSIGSILVDIIKKDRLNFDVKLLSCSSNFKLLFKQASALNVKNLIITDKKTFLKVIKIHKYRKFKIYNNFEVFSHIFKKKIDYCMSAISGIYGLVPTCSVIQYCNNLAIANKEAIICGWPIINYYLNKLTH